MPHLHDASALARARGPASEARTRGVRDDVVRDARASHAERAQANGRALARRSTLLVGGVIACGAALVLQSALGGCGPSGQAASKAGKSPEVAQIDELVEALTPIAPDLTSDILDRHWHHGQELLAKAKAGPRAVGLVALQRLREGAPKDEKGVPIQPVELGLLSVAAHAAPEDARPLLEALVLQFGPSLYLRTEALLCLAETSPQRALEILEPMVTKARPTQTMPPAEFIVGAWIIACDKTGRSPVKELADVATNLFYDETARIKATKELGKRKEPLAAKALSAILIESTGDGYLRRMASQGLRDVLSREDACEIFRQVFDREADENMKRFLLDMIEKNCGK